MIQVRFLTLLVLLLIGLPLRASTPAAAPEAKPAPQASVFPVDRPLPWAPGEKLIYRIGWGIFDVGEATIETRSTTRDGQPAWEVHMTARTNGFADAFYKVRNDVKAWIDPHANRSLANHTSQLEGSTDRETKIHFDWERRTATRTDLRTGESLPPLSVPDGTFEALGVTWHARTLDLQPGDTYTVPVSNGRLLLYNRVSYVRDEVRKTKLGKLPCMVMQPDVTDADGVFQKTKDSTVTFWFSKDGQRWPVRMESSVAIGKFWAQLIAVEPTGPATGMRQQETRLESQASD